MYPRLRRGCKYLSVEGFFRLGVAAVVLSLVLCVVRVR